MKTQNDYERITHIKSQLQKIIGYDEASLLKTAKEAMQKSEEEAAANTEGTNPDLDLEFELLMLRLKSEGKKPVDEKIYDEKYRREDYPTSAGRKKLKKVMIVAAAVCVMLIGATINVVARNEHRVTTYPGVKNRSLLLQFNTSTEMLNDDLDNAYDEISRKLEIPVLMLLYMPEEMNFLDCANDESLAFIRFKYKEKILFLKQSKILEKNFVNATESDRNTCQKVYNKWLNMDLYIEENILDNGEIEYSVNIENEEAFYYFAGVMEKEIFVKIVEAFSYQ